MSKIIGIAGVAKSGKDTLCQHLINLYGELGVSAQRYAFADSLKEGLAPFIADEWGIDLFNCSDEEKELMRPMMVAYGGVYRRTSGGRHWADIVLANIADERPEVAIITDVRYAEIEPTDEVFALLDKGSKIVHVQRRLPDGAWLKPPNDDEQRNDPILQDLADALLKWDTMENSYDRAREFFETHSELFLG